MPSGGFLCICEQKAVSFGADHKLHRDSNDSRLHEELEFAVEGSYSSQYFFLSGGGIRVIQSQEEPSLLLTAAAVGTCIAVCRGSLTNYEQLAAQYLPKFRPGARERRKEAELLIRMFNCLGADVVKKTLGNFCCCLYDCKTMRVLAARDPHGHFPLVEGRTPAGSLIIASGTFMPEGCTEVIEIRPGYLKYGWHAFPRKYSQDGAHTPGGVAAMPRAHSEQLKAAHGVHLKTIREERDAHHHPHGNGKARGHALPTLPAGSGPASMPGRPMRRTEEASAGRSRAQETGGGRGYGHSAPVVGLEEQMKDFMASRRAANSRRRSFEAPVTNGTGNWNTHKAHRHGQPAPLSIPGATPGAFSNGSGAYQPSPSRSSLQSNSLPHMDGQARSAPAKPYSGAGRGRMAVWVRKDGAGGGALGALPSPSTMPGQPGLDSGAATPTTPTVDMEGADGEAGGKRRRRRRRRRCRRKSPRDVAAAGVDGAAEADGDAAHGSGSESDWDDHDGMDSVPLTPAEPPVAGMLVEDLERLLQADSEAEGVQDRSTADATAAAAVAAGATSPAHLRPMPDRGSETLEPLSFAKEPRGSSPAHSVLAPGSWPGFTGLPSGPSTPPTPSATLPTAATTGAAPDKNTGDDGAKLVVPTPPKARSLLSSSLARAKRLGSLDAESWSPAMHHSESMGDLARFASMLSSTGEETAAAQPLQAPPPPLERQPSRSDGGVPPAVAAAVSTPPRQQHSGEVGMPAGAAAGGVAPMPQKDGGMELPEELLTQLVGSDVLLSPDVRRMLQRLLSSESCGVTVADARQPDQPMVYVNRCFELQTGYQASEVLGRNCRFLQAPHGAARLPTSGSTAVRRALAAGTSRTVKLMNFRRDGTPMWNWLSIVPLRGAGGQITHYVGMQSFVLLAEGFGGADHDGDDAAHVMEGHLPRFVGAGGGGAGASMLKSRSCTDLAGMRALPLLMPTPKPEPGLEMLVSTSPIRGLAH